LICGSGAGEFSGAVDFLWKRLARIRAGEAIAPWSERLDLTGVSSGGKKPVSDEWVERETKERIHSA